MRSIGTLVWFFAEMCAIFKIDELSNFPRTDGRNKYVSGAKISVYVVDSAEGLYS